jgi:hypothetical protein
MLVLMLRHMVFGVLIQLHVDFDVTRFVFGVLLQLYAIIIFGRAMFVFPGIFFQ